MTVASPTGRRRRAGRPAPPPARGGRPARDAPGSGPCRSSGTTSTSPELRLGTERGNGPRRHRPDRLRRHAARPRVPGGRRAPRRPGRARASASPRSMPRSRRPSTDPIDAALADVRERLRLLVAGGGEVLCIAFDALGATGRDRRPRRGRGDAATDRRRLGADRSGSSRRSRPRRVRPAAGSRSTRMPGPTSRRPTRSSGWRPRSRGRRPALLPRRRPLHRRRRRSGRGAPAVRRAGDARPPQGRRSRRSSRGCARRPVGGLRRRRSGAGSSRSSGPASWTSTAILARPRRAPLRRLADGRAGQRLAAARGERRDRPARAGGGPPARVGSRPPGSPGRQARPGPSAPGCVRAGPFARAARARPRPSAPDGVAASGRRPCPGPRARATRRRPRAAGRSPSAVRPPTSRGSIRAAARAARKTSPAPVGSTGCSLRIGG